MKLFTNAPLVAFTGMFSLSIAWFDHTQCDKLHITVCDDINRMGNCTCIYIDESITSLGAFTKCITNGDAHASPLDKAKSIKIPTGPKPSSGYWTCRLFGTANCGSGKTLDVISGNFTLEYNIWQGNEPWTYMGVECFHK